MPGTAGTDRHGLVAVARVAKAHGIRGELCMDIHADSPLLFVAGGTLFLVPPVAAAPGGRDFGRPPRPGSGRPRPYVIAVARENNGRLIVALEGVADRNAAEALRGAEVFISEADLPPPDEGEEYLHRLLGAQVRLADETVVGVFEAILDTPGQLTWIIRAPSAKGAKGEGREILFPAVPEFILGLDADAGLIHIAPPPGLLELYLEEPAQTERPPRPAKPERSAKPGSAAKAEGAAKAARPDSSARSGAPAHAVRPARPAKPAKRRGR